MKAIGNYKPLPALPTGSSYSEPAGPRLVAARQQLESVDRIISFCGLRSRRPGLAGRGAGLSRICKANPLRVMKGRRF
jgi:hypothetical protein